MSEQESPESQPANGRAFADWSFGGLLVLALIGIGLTDFSSGDGLWYWLCVAPIFAGVSAVVAFTEARAKGEDPSSTLGRQLLHWASLVPALGVVYVLGQTGRLNRDDAGLVSLLVLALTVLLAGVHFAWRLALLGGVLGLAAIAAALVEEFFWLILAPVILAAIVYVWWKRSGNEAPQ